MSYLFVFAGSYVAVQVVTFTECNPFDHYWIVLPDPGTCTEAQVQLITLGKLPHVPRECGMLMILQGVLNIITDVMLIVLPLPVLAKLKRSFSQYGISIPWNIHCLSIARKIELYILFSLGVFIGTNSHLQACLRCTDSFQWPSPSSGFPRMPATPLLKSIEQPGLPPNS